MTEDKRFIQGSDCYSSRYLHSDEKFRKERNWNINLPPIREFKSGECIVTDKDDTAYSVDELVDLLNNFMNESVQLKKENNELKQQIKELRKVEKLAFNKGLIGQENREIMSKQCNNCKHWRLGTTSLNDNYCSLTGEWTDYEGFCENWKSF